VSITVGNARVGMIRARLCSLQLHLLYYALSIPHLPVVEHSDSLLVGVESTYFAPLSVSFPLYNYTLCTKRTLETTRKTHETFCTFGHVWSLILLALCNVLSVFDAS
jgi:hypothetical protein